MMITPTLFAVPQIAPSVTVAELFGPLAALAPAAVAAVFVVVIAGLFVARRRSRAVSAPTVTTPVAATLRSAA